MSDPHPPLHLARAQSLDPSNMCLSPWQTYPALFEHRLTLLRPSSTFLGVHWILPLLTGQSSSISLRLCGAFLAVHQLSLRLIVCRSHLMQLPALPLSVAFL